MSHGMRVRTRSTTSLELTADTRLSVVFHSAILSAGGSTSIPVPSYFAMSRAILLDIPRSITSDGYAGESLGTFSFDSSAREINYSGSDTDVTIIVGVHG